MQNLLVVIPFHGGDFDQAKDLLNWIVELGKCEPHSALLCADSKVPQEKVRELLDIARKSFKHASAMIVDVKDSKFPPNAMFLNAARQVKEIYRYDFLWLESDAIPTHKGWLNEIAKEYSDSPRRYMGSIISQEGQPGMPAKYFNGVGVYPNDAYDLFMTFPTIQSGEQAWDIASASAVVPRAMSTELIYHYFGTKELPPVFVDEKKSDAPKNHVDISFVPPKAAIFHRSKDGGLVKILRKKLK